MKNRKLLFQVSVMFYKAFPTTSDAPVKRVHSGDVMCMRCKQIKDGVILMDLHQEFIKSQK